MPTQQQRRFENPVFGDVATFLETSAESGGARTLIEVEQAPGGGTSPHVHRSFVERFEVLRGRLVVHVEGDACDLGPGEVAEARPGQVHRFSNDTDQTTVFRVELRPGPAGFEHGLRIAYGLAADGRTNGDGVPKNLLHAALLMEMTETRPAGVLALLGPPLRLLASIARRRGVERELAERYLGARAAA